MAQRVFLTCCYLLLLAGCSSSRTVQIEPDALPEKYYQSVRVDTPGMHGAECTLRSEQTSYSLIAPGTITIERSPYPIRAACQKGDHFEGGIVIEPVLVNAHAPTGGQYIYPYLVSIPMSLQKGSLKIDDIKVF